MPGRRTSGVGDYRGRFHSAFSERLIYNYQALIAGLLAVAGAALVLVSGNRQIDHERKLAPQAKEDRANAARVRLATYFEAMAEQFETVVWDIDVWRQESNNEGLPPANLLQVPKLVLREIAELPLAEAE